MIFVAIAGYEEYCYISHFQLSVVYTYIDDSLPGTEDNYEFAVKMMFNYGVESNSESIYKAMIKELVPARLTAVSQPSTSWQNG